LLGPRKRKKRGKYILGGENLTIAQLAGLVRESAQKRGLIISVPNPLLLGLCKFLERISVRTPVPLDVLEYAMLYWFMDSSKAGTELGYRFRPAREIFPEVVKWLFDMKLVA